MSQKPSNTTTDHQPRISISPNSVVDNLQAINGSDGKTNVFIQLRLQSLQPALQYVIPAGLYEEKRVLKARVEDLNIALEENTKRYDNEIHRFKKMVKEKDQSISNLNTMILKLHRRDFVHTDAEIANKFIKLRSSILEFCKTHLPGGIKFPRELNVLPEMSELAMRAEVAYQLYFAFFNPSLQLFGHLDDSYSARASKGRGGIGLSVGYRVIENHIMTSSNPEMTENELREWRAMTVKLTRKIAPDQDGYPRVEADRIWNQHLGKYGAAKTKTPGDFIQICKTAYHLALLFRSSRVDYEWQQVINPSHLPSQDLDILGTLGPSQKQPFIATDIVFGGVVRGNRDTGKLRDGATTILPHSVVIGYLNANKC